MRALLTDGAGTLLTLAEPPWRVYARIAQSHGLPVPPGLDLRLRQVMAERRPPPLEGVRLEAVPALEEEDWRRIVRFALGDEAADGVVFRALNEHYAARDAWRMEPGAEAALDRVRMHGIRVGLVTNMDATLADLLRAFDLERRIDAVLSPSTVGLAKPDPRIFHEALEALAVRPEDALYLGDRERDCLEGARRAGLRTIRYDPNGDRSRADVLVEWATLPSRVGVENV